MKLATLVTCAFLALACTAQADELKVAAGAAPTENILKPVAAPFEKATGIRLSIVASGPSQAMIDLERGAVEAAAAGLTMDDWLALMKKEGHEVKDPASLQHTNIGKDRIVVIVNKENPVKQLTDEQLKGIFSGTIANWKEVGSFDQPILVVWGKLIQGTNKMFKARIMAGTEPTKDVLDATTAEDIKLNVTANPSAIGIGPLAAVDDTVNAPQISDISRDVILATKGKPTANVQKLLDFIAGPGQKFIKK